jgi:CHAT domain-containing protein
VTFERASQAFLHGQVKQCQEEAGKGYERFRNLNSEWAWKFITLEAKAALWRGLYEDVLRLLKSAPPPSDHPDLLVPILTLIGIADVNTHNFSEAQHSLADATRLCDSLELTSCGYVLQARGLLASELTQSSAAEQLYQQTLTFAHSHRDSFLESDALLNLGAESLAQGRFDEAIDRSEAAYQVAKAADARIPELVAEGNIGWAYYMLGDSDRALELSVESEHRAAELSDFFDQENELTNIGYIYMDERKLDRAGQAFQQALSIAERIKAKQDIYNARRVLARLALQTNDIEQASENAEKALEIARQSGNRVDELYPRLVQGQVAARRADIKTAESTFSELEHEKLCPIFLKWEAEHSLARLYQEENHAEAADREYRTSLATFEAARDDVRHEDFQLSFLTNAAPIYDDYIHFLVARGKTQDALRWADYNRARNLAEGLGVLPKGISNGPPALNPQQIAQGVNGTILFYWLGENQSYLWAITPQKTNLYTLPPGPEIDAAARRYRNALAGPQDVLASADSDGQWLYRTLIRPAQQLLPKDARVFVIPDGSLNNLNFETLLVSEPTRHYWIEDATIIDASSLRMLGAPYQPAKKPRNLLLIGNSVAPNEKYPELPKAAAQIETVAKHFPEPGRQIYDRERATPLAYLSSNPEQFSYIHFVAHGTASRLSPLDSAIVLSKSNAKDDSFKLYARDIIQRPLHADLVTISACYGAGARLYSGEGLVGLSWAFLRAGAHNVIAALWEATDSSTEQLMSRFYDELDRGTSPDAALRIAKLSLLHGTGFRNPFYWAPFQLYGKG